MFGITGMSAMLYKYTKYKASFTGYAMRITEEAMGYILALTRQMHRERKVIRTPTREVLHVF